MLMTTEQVYSMAGAESKPLDHIKSCKLRYFGHVNTERSVMTCLVEGIRGCGRPRVMAGQHHGMDWPVRDQLVVC